MHISRLVLNMRNSQARHDVAIPYELHRTLVTRGFSENIEKRGRVLFRIEPERESQRHGGPVILVQSSGAPPSWTGLLPGYSLGIDGPRTFQPTIVNGQMLGFRLVANPIERRRQRDEHGNELWSSGEKPHVRFHRRPLMKPEQQEEWLDRQGIVHTCESNGALVGGFKVRYVTITPLAGPRHRPDEISHEKKYSIPHIGVRFDGVIEVTHAEAFLNTLSHGVGPAKAFGFGFLSIAPLR